MKNMLKWLCILSVLLWITPGLALAQEKSSVTVTPAFAEIVLEGTDAEKKTSVTIENNSKEPYVAHLSVLDFGSLDESGGVAFLGDKENLERKYALASWLRLETDTVVLGPGEAKEVEVTIENRESLSPGGHYGALIFRLGNEEKINEATNHVAVEQVFSSLFFVKKVGGEVYRMELREKQIEKRLVFVPKAIALRFENSGNVHVVPRGLITVEDPLKRVVAKGIINEESSILLPESFREYKSPIQALRSAWFPGKYTAKIAYRYDGNEAFMEESASFFVFPLQSIAVLGGILILLAFRLFRMRQASPKLPLQQ